MQEKKQNKKSTPSSPRMNSKKTVPPNKYTRIEEIALPEEEIDPEFIPEEDPYETPNYENPEPGEGP